MQDPASSSAWGTTFQRDRLDASRVSELDLLVGEMFEGSATIRSEAQNELSQEKIGTY